MTTGNAELDVKLNNPSDPNCPKFKDVYQVLIDQLQSRWYDVFLHLGIGREILDKCLKDHPFDYHSSLVKILTVWLQREDPPPSWQALVDVLQNRLLEGKLAVTIKRNFCPELLVESDVQKREESDSQDDSPPYIDEESLQFSKLLSDITEKLGAHSFAELQHYLLQMRCPDGTPLVDAENVYSRRSTDALLIPLVANNLCNSRDLDILIHVLRGLQREDLLPLISAYVPKVTIGTPYIRPIDDDCKSFVVKVVLNQALKQLDLGIVSAIKHDLCTCFGILEKPYLMQYLGWEQDPIVLHFQVPTPCMHMVEEGLGYHFSALHGNGIDHVELEISNTTFRYPMWS